MKDSLVFYISQYEAVKELNDQQLGALYRAIFETALGNDPEIPPDIKIAFNFIRNQIEIDLAKYEKTSKARSEAGKKSGQARAKQTKRTNVNFVQQNELNDNENDNDNDNDNENANDNDCLAERVIFQGVTNPDLISALNDYIDARETMRRPVTDAAIPLLIEKLNDMSSDVSEQIAIVKQSTMNGWQSFVPIDKRKAEESGGILEGWENL